MVSFTRMITQDYIQLIYPRCDKFEQIKFESLNQYRTKMKISGTALSWTGMVVVSSWSALVNIRRKALLSSVGFRKRMTSRSPRASPCDSCKLCFDRPLWFVWWSDVCFEVLSCFFDHPSIESTKKMPLHLFGKDVLMFRLDQAS